MQKKVPDYLLRIINDYLGDRWVIYEGDKWSLKEKMPCGAPQGSRVGPLVWDVMYDDDPAHGPTCWNEYHRLCG